MNRACLAKDVSLHEQKQHASSIRPIKNNFVRMKMTFTLILLALLVSTLSAQEKHDSTSVKKTKTGWNFGGALPAITYDSDLGFEYGALAEFFNYGDGSKYPDFLDHTYTEISRYTKGSGTYRFMYESNHIIPEYTGRAISVIFLTRQIHSSDLTDMNQFIIRHG